MPSKLTTPTLDEVRGELAKLLKAHDLTRYHVTLTRLSAIRWGFRGRGSASAIAREALAVSYPFAFAYAGYPGEFLPVALLFNRVAAKILRRVEIRAGFKKTAKFEFHKTGLVTVRTAKGLKRFGPG